MTVPGRVPATPPCLGEVGGPSDTDLQGNCILPVLWALPAPCPCHGKLDSGQLDADLGNGQVVWGWLSPGAPQVLFLQGPCRHRRTKTALGTSKHFIEGPGDAGSGGSRGRARPWLSLQSSRRSTAAAWRAASFSHSMHGEMSLGHPLSPPAIPDCHP